MGPYILAAFCVEVFRSVHDLVHSVIGTTKQVKIERELVTVYGRVILHSGIGVIGLDFPMHISNFAKRQICSNIEVVTASNKK